MKIPESIIRSKPVTEQVEEILRERISRGVYSPEQRMPSEDHLAQELKISRASVRSAMASLASKGYIQRKHGDGTYPSPRAFNLGFRVGKVWDIIRQIQESGRQATLKVLEQEFHSPSSDEIISLSLAPTEQVLSMRRLFLADEKPVALISNIVRSAGMATDIPEDSAIIPPLDFLGRFHQQKPGMSKVFFYAILADQTTADLLQIEQGSPLLKMSGVLFDLTGIPIMFETEIYPGQEGFQMQAGIIHS
jgi:DNA-binding GntR family transcriptional regulator